MNPELKDKVLEFMRANRNKLSIWRLSLDTCHKFDLFCFGPAASWNKSISRMPDWLMDLAILVGTNKF